MYEQIKLILTGRAQTQQSQNLHKGQKVLHLTHFLLRDNHKQILTLAACRIEWQAFDFLMTHDLRQSHWTALEIPDPQRDYISRKTPSFISGSGALVRFL